MCHQSIGLIARAFETAGIPTATISTGLSISQGVGTPRIVYSDMPLGRPLGHPFDIEGQRSTVLAALNLAVSMTVPGTVAYLANEWSLDHSWKDRAGKAGQSSDGVAPPPVGTGDDRTERDESPMWDRPSDAIAYAETLGAPAAS